MCEHALTHHPDSYLLDPFLRLQAGVSLQGSVVVCDEAHNLASHACQQGSLLLSRAQVALILREEELATKAPTIQSLLSGLHRMLHTHSRIVCGVGSEAVADLLRRCAVTAASIAAMQAEVAVHEWGQDTARRLTQQLVTVLGYMLAHPQRYAVRYLTSSLSLACLHAGVVLACLTAPNHGPHSVIAASGTMPADFTRDTDMPFTTVSGDHVIAADALWLYTVGVTRRGELLHCTANKLAVQSTRATSNTAPPATPSRVAELTVDAIACLPPGSGCLVFLPSYAALGSVVVLINDRLQQRSSPVQVTLLQEPRNAAEYVGVVAQFNGSPRTRVLLCVHRGKAAEGVEFRRGAVQLVVSVGIPYPNLGDQHFKDRLAYQRSKYSKSDADRWVHRQAYTAIYQCLGRCVRGPADRAAVLMVDDRFWNGAYRGFAPTWLHRRIAAEPNGIPHARTAGECTQALASLRTFLRTCI